MPLPQRTLGNGLTVSALGLGCMSLSSGFYGSGIAEADAITLIRRAHELGVTLFNTSDLYGPYTNEELLGKAVAPFRDSVVIATKWGPMLDPATGTFQNTQTRAYARAAAEGALRRLQTDRIDLFTLRGPVQPGVDIAEVMAEVKELVGEGKVRHVGLSEVGPAHIRAAHAVVPITAIEQEWSLFVRDLEDDLLPVCRELGIGVLAYSPLARGMLTGALKDTSQLDPKDFRHHAPWFTPEHLPKNLAYVAQLERLAAAKGVTPAQLALAWLLARAPDVVPIPGTKRLHVLEENVAAASITLSPEELAGLEAAVPAGAACGSRYGDMAAISYAGNL